MLGTLKSLPIGTHNSFCFARIGVSQRILYYHLKLEIHDDKPLNSKNDYVQIWFIQNCLRFKV